MYEVLVFVAFSELKYCDTKECCYVVGFKNIGSTVSKFGGSRLHQYCSGLVHPTL